jgi:hypothetical protein
VEYKRLEPNTLDKLVKEAVAFDTDSLSRPERVSIEKFRLDTLAIKVVLKLFDNDVIFCPSKLDRLFALEMVKRFKLDKDASNVLDRPISEVDTLLDREVMFWPSKFDKLLRLELDWKARVDNEDPIMLDRLDSEL